MIGRRPTNSAYPAGTETVVTKVTLSEEEARYAKKLGTGFASRGLRILVQERLEILRRLNAHENQS